MIAADLTHHCQLRSDSCGSSDGQGEARKGKSRGLLFVEGVDDKEEKGVVLFGKNIVILLCIILIFKIMFATCRTSEQIQLLL